MSASCVLVHFCEQHGPSIVFTTQEVAHKNKVYEFPSTFDLEKLNTGKWKQTNNINTIKFQFPETTQQSNQKEESQQPNNNNMQNISPTNSIENGIKIHEIVNNEMQTTTQLKNDGNQLDTTAVTEMHQISINNGHENSSKENQSIVNNEMNASQPNGIHEQSKIQSQILTSASSQINNNNIQTNIQSDQKLEITNSNNTNSNNNAKSDLNSIVNSKVLDSFDDNYSLILNKKQKDEKQDLIKRISSGQLSDFEQSSILYNNSGQDSKLSVSVEMKTITEQSKDSFSSAPKRACESCASLPPNQGLLSVEKQKYIVSTAYPSPDTYSVVRTACVRSLSCEVCPGREGAMLFESDRQWTFAYMFYLKDSKARGASRWYSFLVLTKNFPYLVRSTVTLTQFFESLVGRMQKRAEMLFHKESQQQQNDQRHVNLSRRQISTQRSIVDLTSDPEFFHHLHAQFSSVLNQLDADFRFRYSLSQSLSCNSNQDSNELTQQVGSSARFTSLQSVLERIGIESMKFLIYNVLIGNQIVVQSPQSESQLGISLLEQLKTLLPKALVSMIPFSTRYRESYECNFLGVPDTVNVPSYVDRSTFAIVTIIQSKVDSAKKISMKDPLQFFELIFSGENLSSEMAEQVMEILRLNVDEEFKRIRLKSVKQSWKTKAKALCRLSQEILTEKDPKVRAFQRLFDLSDIDMLTIRFWSAGLRKQVLNPK